MSKPRGTVYLIHFEKPYKHARHYIGYTKQAIEDRLADHRSNQGSRLLEVINNAGIPWGLARVWKHASRKFERRLKRFCNSSRLCPVCHPKPSRITPRTPIRERVKA